MLKNRSTPLGYYMLNEKYALNTHEAAVKIFADYISGKSLKTIAAEMQMERRSNQADHK